MRAARRLCIPLLLVPLTAFADTSSESAFIVRSLLPGQEAKVQADTNGLDNLPLLEFEAHIDLASRRVTGHARLDWRNNTGHTVRNIPIRFSANGGARGPRAGWTHVKITLPGGSATTARARRRSKTISVITLPAPLPPNARVVIEGDLDERMGEIAPGATDPVSASLMALTGGQARKPDGDQYGTFACGDEICTLTGFTPEVPAFIGGRFDTAEGSGIGDATYSEPENIIMSVVVPSGVQLAVTGVEIGHIPQGNNKVRWTFAMAAAREPAIVASSDFAVDETTVDGVRVRSFSRNEDRDNGRKALDSAASALRVLDQAYGQYPWAQLTVAESGLVGGAGGVELPSMTLVGSGFYQQGGGLLASLGGGALTGDMLDFITRHEVAHQWWAMQVGSHSQLHPYIDEPLAQWSALYTVEQSEGQEAAKRMREMQVAANFQALAMMGIPDGVVERPCRAFHSELEYAGLVYGKAPLFYDAAAKLIGEDRLVATLRSVVASFQFRRVTPRELRDALIQGAGAEGAQMNELWRRWFEETHGSEDVGTLDIGGLSSALGLGSVTSNPQDTAAAMQLLQQLMQQMGGSQ